MVSAQELREEPPILIHRVIARLNVGGPAMHVVNLARALDKGPWRTRLVAGSVPPTEGDMGYYAAERGVRVISVEDLSRDISPLADLRALWRLVRLFRRERPRVVHTHTAKAGTVGRIAAILTGVPVRIHTFHGHVLGGSYFAPWKNRIFLEIERQLARGTNRLVVLTRRQAEEMHGVLSVAPREKFAVVPLGLELDRFVGLDRAPARRRIRSELGIPDSAMVIGIVGRLVPVKNHPLFLEALAAAVAGSGRPVVGVVVGGGGEERRLKDLAGGLGLDGSLRWLGWRRDLPELYAAMDLLALTSHDEGTPVAVLEGLAAGTPVAVRDVGGVREVLERVGAGRLLPVDAPASRWAETFLAESAGGPLSREVRERVGGLFSVERLAADVADLYRYELARVGR